MIYFRRAVIALLIVSCNTTIAVDNAPSSCPDYNQVALQFALAQTGMQSPLNLQDLKNKLGDKKPASTPVLATFSWAHNDKILLITTLDDAITNRLLTGSDNSLIAKKMDRLYEQSKAQTSIRWFIKKIRAELGQEHEIKKQLYNYIWQCGILTIKITADEQKNITETTIQYNSTNKQDLDLNVGINHPAWDFETGWKRTFKQAYQS